MMASSTSLLDTLRLGGVWDARGNSSLHYGRRFLGKDAVSIAIVLYGTRVTQMHDVLRYARLMDRLTGKLRIAVFSDSSDVFLPALAQGWMVEHFAEFPRAPEMAAPVVEGRLASLRVSVVLVPGEYGVTRAMHYHLCGSLGCRIRWTAIAAQQGPPHEKIDYFVGPLEQNG